MGGGNCNMGEFVMWANWITLWVIRPSVMGNSPFRYGQFPPTTSR